MQLFAIICNYLQFYAKECNLTIPRMQLFAKECNYLQKNAIVVVFKGSVADL